MKTLNERFFENKEKREVLVGKYANALNVRDWDQVDKLKKEMVELKEELDLICREAVENENKKVV